MTALNPHQFLEIAPKALNIYKQAFEHVNSTLLPFGILENVNRLSHFLAQVMHETGGLTVLVENLNYRAERLVEVWPTRFPTIEKARPFAGDPRALANKVYGGRLGNEDPDDGWKFIGRGLLQLTGRYNYQRIGRMLSADFVENPNLVIMPEFALPVAAAVWKASHCNELADINDIRKVRKAINGGYIGLLDCIRWHKKISVILGILPERRA